MTDLKMKKQLEHSGREKLKMGKSGKEQTEKENNYEKEVSEKRQF